MSNKMTRREYLDYSFKRELYKSRDWIINAFSICESDEKTALGIIFRTPSYLYFKDIDNGEEVIISDAKATEAVFSIKDQVEVLFGMLPNITEATVTTLGNLLFNACVVSYAFGKKIPYCNSKKTADIGYLEKLIANRLQSGFAPEGGGEVDKFFIDEYLRFGEGFQYLQGFNFLWVQCVTERLLQTPPNNSSLKKEIVNKVGDTIGKPAVLASVYKELDDNDKVFLAGDPGETFINKKVRVARRKMFLIQGGEAGLEGGDTFDIATNSLAEGIEVAKFPVYNNVLRAGSLNRGYETQLGGVATKEMLRATSNIRIVKGDCGSKLGRRLLITKENANRQLVGFSVVTERGPVFVKDPEAAGAYIGKRLIRRSAMYCKTTGENFCEVCVGQRYATHPTGVAMGITNIGGTLLGIFMSAMHAKELVVHDLELDQITQ